ncbi:hypothetical protein [Kribbella sp. NPDC023855]|uniref:hypothetical protein n=1 Tax=Kribbella sp. NPDC023855 TaxID=3154698 RepID=UPI0033D57207
MVIHGRRRVRNSFGDLLGDWGEHQLIRVAGGPVPMRPHDDRQDDYADEESSASGGQEVADLFFLVDEDGRITSIADQADGGPLLWHADGEPGDRDRSAAWFADFTPQPFALGERPERRPLISRYQDGAVMMRPISPSSAAGASWSAITTG